jgi:hypothetical protein
MKNLPSVLPCRHDFSHIILCTHPRLPNKLPSLLIFDRSISGMACLIETTRSFFVFQNFQVVSKAREAMDLQLGVEPSKMMYHQFLIVCADHC